MLKELNKRDEAEIGIQSPCPPFEVNSGALKPSTDGTEN
jgi:hypothetical protein